MSDDTIYATKLVIFIILTVFGVIGVVLRIREGYEEARKKRLEAEKKP
jgi:hypothetical protein